MVNMDLFTRADLRALLAEHEPPCISLFMPAHRGGAEEDPIRFRKLLGLAEERLVAHGLRAPEARKFLAPLHSMLEDASFWPNQCDGLAAFLARDFLRVYRLPWTFQEELEVGGLFVVAPLLPLLHGDGRFCVLAVSQHGVRLFQGTRFTVSSIDVKGVPRDLAEVLALDKEEVFTFHSYPTAAAGGSQGFIGHEVGTDDRKDDLLRYFQRIDRGLHPLLREEKAPLVLAAVDYLQPIYREANTYAHLLEKGIEGNPDRLSSKELHDRAWPLVKPLFEETQQRAAAQYRQLAGTGHASGDLEAVVAAAYEGRVETLFVSLGRQVWGVFDPATGRVERHEQALFGDVDLLDLAAACTLAHGRTVYAMEPARFPSSTEVAAIFCHPLPKHGKRP